MYRAPLYNLLKKFAQENPARFFMPGHKGGEGLEDSFLAPVMPYDVTELSNTGNLYEEAGVIEEAQKLAASAFGAKTARFCTGGATQGLHGALFLAAKRGRRILLDRGAHVSVIKGCILFDLVPDYVQAEPLFPFGIGGGFDPEKIEAALKKEHYAAFVVTSPTYYGVVRDIAALSALCKKYRTLLIVDGAHGAHLGFHPALPPPAQKQGADLTVASAHKTLGALGQGAYFFSNCEGFSKREIIEALSLTGTTSPSYLIMASLDYARAFMAEKGEERLGWLLAQNERVKKALRKASFRPLCEEDASPLARFDESRLVIYCGDIGLTGFELYTFLEKSGVVCEMADEAQIVLLPSIHNKEEDFDRLMWAFVSAFWQPPKKKRDAPSLPPLPERVLTPREAAFRPRKRMPAEMCEGKICAQTLMRYPPGVPFLVPGEKIEGEVFSYLKSHVTGDIFVVK